METSRAYLQVRISYALQLEARIVQMKGSWVEETGRTR